MNILITGAGGFIESHIYNYLKDKYSFTRIFSSNHLSTGKQCHFVDLTEITKVETLAQNLSNANIEAVIHLASRM
ncbi:MAG: NAD-dependent epimerase/dehydratase family protein, partial [Bacteroidetes bacterium]|nr:NAD-dependent epimerase/dehydratase family protein [Bacteroidota bacterium]